MDLRAAQQPLKDRYAAAPEAAHITLRACSTAADTPIACSVDVGRQVQRAGAHPGVGGGAGLPCSGDLLLSALAACAQLTCQMVAAAMGLEPATISVTAEGDLDLRGTLGISRDARVGFETLRLRFDIRDVEATAETLERLRERTERYCVVYQTLLSPPPITTTWHTTA